MQRRVLFAVLRQLAEHGTADPATTAAMVPGADQRDLTMALENLLDDGSIEGPTAHPEPLVKLAEAGWLTLTALGRQRIDGDEV
jgi:hypothetical protein